MISVLTQQKRKETYMFFGHVGFQLAKKQKNNVFGICWCPVSKKAKAKKIKHGFCFVISVSSLQKSKTKTVVFVMIAVSSW